VRLASLCPQAPRLNLADIWLTSGSNSAEILLARQSDLGQQAASAFK
jgi:hypothetical protein